MTVLDFEETVQRLQISTKTNGKPMVSLDPYNWMHLPFMTARLRTDPSPELITKLESFYKQQILVGMQECNRVSRLFVHP